MSNVKFWLMLLLTGLLSMHVLSATTGFEGNGLIGSYYADPAFANLAATRVDGPLDFDWAGAPIPGMTKSDYCVRWQGSVQAPVDGRVTFSVSAATGDEVRFALALPDTHALTGRAWQEVVKGRADGGALLGSVTLTRGETYAVIVELHHATGAASMHLTWAYAGSTPAPIPASALLPREPLSVSFLGRAWLPIGLGGTSPASAALTSSGPRLRLTLAKGDAANAVDQGVLAARELQGDGHLVMRLTGATGATGVWQAGAMVREGDALGARLVSLSYAAGKLSLQSRAKVNGPLQSVGEHAVQMPVWIKLARNGPTVCGYTSATGADDSWSLLGRVDLPFLADRLLLGLSGASTAGGAVANCDNVEALADVPLGGNLGGSATWGLYRPLKDLVRNSLGAPCRINDKGNGLLKESPALGADGWPTEDFGFSGEYLQYPEHLAGQTLLLTFTGKATVQQGFWGPVSFLPADAVKTKDAGFADGYNAASNTSRYYASYAGKPAATLGISVMFVKTQRTPDAAIGSGVTNVSLLMPGYTQDDEQNIFSEEFLTSVKRASAFRFMDWAQTNGSAVQKWSERTLPRSAGLSTNSEHCWEYMVQLCNLTGRDMWVNIPVQADAEYIKQLATLIHNGSTIHGVTYPGLRPDLNVYVEFSNEVWNYGFLSYRQLSDLAWGAVQNGNKFGPKGILLAEGIDTPKQGDQGLNYRWLAAHMAGDIVPAFAAAFGADAICARVRPVIAGWTIAPDGTFGSSLNFLRQAGWNPRETIYAVSVTGYFGYKDLLEAHASASERRDSLTMENGLASFEAGFDVTSALMKDGAIAAAYGVKLVAYETGPSTGQTKELGDGERDPRFRNITVDGLNTWFASGGSLSNFFAFGYSAYGGHWGDWTISDNPWDQNQPRNLAYSDVRSQAGAPPLVNGPLLLTPFLLDARMGCGVSNYSDLVVARPDWASPYRYCVRSLRAQSVALRLNATAGEAGQTFSPALNGVPLADIALPAPAVKPAVTPCQDTTPVTLMLREGLNYLTLQPKAADGSTKMGNNAPMLNCLKFTAVDAATVPPTLPWVTSQMNTQCRLTENASWSGKFLFADGVTPANGWSGELSSENAALIPNDALHLAVTRDQTTGMLLVTITPAANQVGKTGVLLRVRNAQGVARDWHFAVSVTPLAPKALMASASPDGAVQLHWQNVSTTANFFDIERTDTPKNGRSWMSVNRLAFSGGAEASYSDTPPGGKNWYYRVQAGRIIPLPTGNTESVSGTVMLKDPVTPPLVGGEGHRAVNLLTGKTVFAKGLDPAFAADGGKSLIDADDMSVDIFAADGSGAVAFTGLAGDAIRAMAFWTPTVKDFTGKSIPMTDALPDVTVYASTDDLTAAGATSALDPAHYHRVTDQPMPLSDGKSWWVGDIKLPVRVYPDTSECWVSPCTGLNVPAGTKSLLLVFAASKAGPRFAEIQAFSSFDETPPATLQAKSAWKQFAPATFANPCGPVVDITWTATPGVYTHYVVQRGLDERFRGGVQTVPLPPNSTHFVNDCQQQFRGITENGNGPLAPSTDYYYRVGVRKPDGTLVWGNNTVKVHTASPDQTRLTPATLTAKASIGSTVTLAWPAVPGALGYKLERAENATFSNGRTGLVMVTTPGYTDRTAETGASNFYRVRATYADGDSDWATATITTPELSPPPTTLRAEVNVGTVHLKWDSTHGKLHGYEVYRGTDAAHLTPLMPMNIGSPQLQFGDFTDRNVPAGHWCYAVRGVWFTAAFPSEMKYTEFTPAIEVVVP